MNRQITLASRPVGYPKESDFNLIEVPIPTPEDGEVLVKTLYLSVDPYMRGRINAAKSYAANVEIDEVMVGSVIAQVIASKHPNFEVGDIVNAGIGWQEYGVAAGNGLRKIDPTIAPISTGAGILGMPGLTAYFGLLVVGKLQERETVFVSGAAGAVGSVVGQIAKIKGCRVVGSAGTDEKVSLTLLMNSALMMPLIIKRLMIITKNSRDFFLMALMSILITSVEPSRMPFSSI